MATCGSRMDEPLLTVLLRGSQTARFLRNQQCTLRERLKPGSLPRPALAYGARPTVR